jgi:enamine deaminase RidA (YjgF/YER057c/UK114 family)
MIQSRNVVSIRTHPSLGADAVRDRGYLYTSGVCAVDENGRVVGPGNLRAQADYVYRALSATLDAAQSGWSDVVKVNYYVAPEVNSADDREVLREAHAQFVPAGRCAVLGAPLPQPVDGCLLRRAVSGRAPPSVRSPRCLAYRRRRNGRRRFKPTRAVSGQLPSPIRWPSS